ncbi:hypothetical protein [Mycobacteroides chelonae]|uniref:hypothetical protein n=1 Tax=Mycobacteroides chelonae TaxID=1774 RepID=UPI0035659562
MSAASILQIVAGGAVGSSLTYALTWFRERRRTLDSYRAPQRQAIGAIVTATNEYLLRQFEVREALEHLADQIRSGGQITSAEDLLTLARVAGAATMTVESAFQTGLLTIEDAVCWEAQVDAYAAFQRLKNASQDQPPVENVYEVLRHIAANAERCAQLAQSVGLLVRAAYGRVSPIGSWTNRLRRRKALERSRERHQGLIGVMGARGETSP